MILIYSTFIHFFFLSYPPSFSYPLPILLAFFSYAISLFNHANFTFYLQVEITIFKGFYHIGQKICSLMVLKGGEKVLIRKINKKVRKESSNDIICQKLSYCK